MKGILFACCFLFAASVIRADIIDPYLEVAKDQMVACGKESGYTDLNPRAIYDKFIKDGADQSNCVGACVMKALGIMANSKIDAAKLNEFNKRVFSDQPEMQAKVEKLANDCIEKAKSVTDECKMAYAYTICFAGNK